MSGENSGPPPLDGSIKATVRFVAELAWALICVVPIILYTLYKKIFPGEGKDLSGKIVLVS